MSQQIYSIHVPLHTLEAHYTFLTKVNSFKLKIHTSTQQVLEKEHLFGCMFRLSQISKIMQMKLQFVTAAV